MIVYTYVKFAAVPFGLVEDFFPNFGFFAIYSIGMILVHVITY